MKEKLQEYTLFAEIISAICIVFSLIFAGLQENRVPRKRRLIPRPLAPDGWSFHETPGLSIHNLKL